MNSGSVAGSSRRSFRLRFALPADDLLRDPSYRRLWLSVLISAYGTQIMILGLPLTAAVRLHASAAEMGVLTAMEVLPFGGKWAVAQDRGVAVVGGEEAYGLTSDRCVGR